MIKNTIKLALFVMCFSIIQTSFSEVMTLQQGLDGYTGCQDIHIGNGDNNFSPACNKPKNPSFYVEDFIG